MSKIYDERVLDAFKDLLLIFNVVHVLALYDLGLLHRLHSVLLRWHALKPADPYVSKSTYNAVTDLSETL